MGSQMQYICFNRVGDTTWDICGYQFDKKPAFVRRVCCPACKTDGLVREVDDADNLNVRYERINVNRS